MSDPSAGFFVAGAVAPVLAATTYANGARRRAATGRAVLFLRQALFAAGIGAFLLSIQWPFANHAHQHFWVHQVGILIARLVAPILIVTSRPAGLLIAGLPGAARRRILKPALSQPFVRVCWTITAHPLTAAALYVASFYVWELPALQADAILSGGAGLTMHFTLLLTGLLFWSRIFERRPAPHAPTHGWRLMMIWIAVLAQILLGAYLTSKSVIMYPAYAGGHSAASALADEQTGGFIIWVLSSLLSLSALVVVIDQFARHETKMDEKRKRWTPSNSAILLYPTTAQALRAMTRTKNRRMAIGMIGFALMVFCAAFGSAVSSHRISKRENMREYRLSRT